MATDRYYLAPGRDVPDEDVVLPDGRHLTEDVRAELVAEVREATRGTGRPSLTAPGRRSPQIGVRLPADERAAVRVAAAKLGITTSEFARRAIARELRRVS